MFVFAFFVLYEVVLRWLLGLMEGYSEGSRDELRMGEDVQLGAHV